MNVLDFLFKVSILQKVVLSQIVEGTRSLFENGELRFVFVTFAADEDVYKRQQERNSFIFMRSLVNACEMIRQNKDMPITFSACIEEDFL